MTLFQLLRHRQRLRRPHLPRPDPDRPDRGPDRPPRGPQVLHGRPPLPRRPRPDPQRVRRGRNLQRQLLHDEEGLAAEADLGEGAAAGQGLHLSAVAGINDQGGARAFAESGWY